MPRLDEIFRRQFGGNAIVSVGEALELFSRNVASESNNNKSLRSSRSFQTKIIIFDRNCSDDKYDVSFGNNFVVQSCEEKHKISAEKAQNN